MKIVSPVDNLMEVPGLIQAGASEFYGGYVPSDWRERFSMLTSINQRTFDTAQISCADELRGIVELAHDAGAAFNLTLNAPFYTDEQLPVLLDYVHETVQLGIDGVILADIALLRALKRSFPALHCHASTLAHVGNSYAASVYRGLGIDSLILPRHLPVSEIASICAALPETRVDVFMLVGKCPNTEGLCTFHHSRPDKIWPCEIPYEIEPVSAGDAMQLAPVIARQNSWSTTNRRHGCGLCAIPHLAAAGVQALKLVGRGAPSMQKLKNVQLVGDFIALAGKQLDFASYRRLAMAAHEKRFGSACSPNVCYYPEYYLGE